MLSQYSVRRNWGIIIRFLFLILSVTADVPPLRMPVFWKQLNQTENSDFNGRLLHDYLSVLPTYGNSKDLGYGHYGKCLHPVTFTLSFMWVLLHRGKRLFWILVVACSRFPVLRKYSALLFLFRCKSCGSHQNAPFNPSLSSTIRISLCVLSFS